MTTTENYNLNMPELTDNVSTIEQISANFSIIDSILKSLKEQTDNQIGRLENKDQKDIDLQNQIDSNDKDISAINDYIGKLQQGNYTTAQSVASDISKLDAQVKKNTDDIGTLTTGNYSKGENLGADIALLDKQIKSNYDKLITLIANDANKSVRTIASEELAKELVPKNAKESLDTIQEISAWIQSHPDDASKMAKSIKTNATNISANKTSIEDLATKVSENSANIANLSESPDFMNDFNKIKAWVAKHDDRQTFSDDFTTKWTDKLGETTS